MNYDNAAHYQMLEWGCLFIWYKLYIRDALLIVIHVYFYKLINCDVSCTIFIDCAYFKALSFSPMK